MRKYKTAAALLIIVLMIAYTFFVDSSNEAKLIILIAGLVVLAVLNRGNAVYAKATKILARKNPAELESAVRLMEKALDLGCSENNTVIAATLVLQHGNIEKAKKSLEEVKDSSKPRRGQRQQLKEHQSKGKDITFDVLLAQRRPRYRNPSCRRGQGG